MKANMKKLLLLCGLALALASSSQAGQGGQFLTQPFINGQFLIITNGYAMEFLNQSNVFYIDNKNLGRYAFANTNLVPTVGAAGTNFNPQVYYWTNNQAYVQSNGLAGGWTTNSQTINPPAIIDVLGIIDANGEPSASAIISTTVYGISSRGYQAGAPTNTLTYTFTKSGDGVNFGAGSVVNYDYMTFALAASVATNYTFITNVPLTFMQGARKIRLNLTSSTVTSGTNVVLSDISLSGFAP